MDWSKAKNVILAVLVLTNLFLGAMYVMKHFQYESDSDDEVYEYTMNVLQENNIFFEGELIERPTRMHTLVVSYGKYDSGIVGNAIENSRSIAVSSSDEKYMDAASDFLEKCGFMSENVQVSSVIHDGMRTVVDYDNYYKDIPVEECWMKVVFENGKIVDFDRKWIEIVERSETKIEVISQMSALLMLMSEKDAEEKITVNDMYITYWIDSYDVDGDVLYDTALPAWCFVCDDGTLRYISAGVQ